MNSKELVVISGKGGTGKTTLTASFAALASQAILADCDVDAADLHLLLHPVVQRREEFRSGRIAEIDPQLCTHCGKCEEVCRYDAIDATHTVNEIACEGCAVCFHCCPVEAITMNENLCGEWYISDTDYGSMVHARLGIAAENSGKLVSTVREQARSLAKEQNASMILIDGPPGIGCPVIASISGADMVLVVTEPTLSGIHDLQRIVELSANFQIKTGVCVNKADINQELTDEIKAYCAKQQVIFFGEIPYDPIIVKALVQQKPLIGFSDGPTAELVKTLWHDVERELSATEA